MKSLVVAAMVAVMSALGAGCAVTSGQTSVGEYVDDATITTRVNSRFAEDKQVSAMRIGVETLKGVVQLSGFATSEAEKQRAAQIAASVPGVKQVQNAVVVRAPQS
jgi:hyperosmotically inducible periplasmic protein